VFSRLSSQRCGFGRKRAEIPQSGFRSTPTTIIEHLFGHKSVKWGIDVAILLLRNDPRSSITALDGILLSPLPLEFFCERGLLYLAFRIDEFHPRRKFLAHVNERNDRNQRLSVPEAYRAVAMLGSFAGVDQQDGGLGG
jgi:hypothetical protein